MELEFFSMIFDMVLLVCSWWPWANTIPESFIIQTILIYLFYLMFAYNSIYYALLYLFCAFFFVGLLLSNVQLELFTAFLWLIECTVIFIFLVLLFYINVKSDKVHFYFDFNKINFFLCVFFLLFCSFFDASDTEFSYLLDFGLFYYWDDYYESIYNFIMNDLFGFLLSYYYLNSVEFSMIGFLLLIGSVLCVTLYKLNKNTRTQNYNSFLRLFDFFKNFVPSLFLRKQNLSKQGNTVSSVKLFNR